MYQIELSIECHDELISPSMELEGSCVIVRDAYKYYPEWYLEEKKPPEFMKENPTTIVETSFWINGNLNRENETKSVRIWSGTLPVMRLDYDSVKDCVGSEDNFQILLRQCPPVQTLEELLTKYESWVEDEDDQSDAFCWDETLLKIIPPSDISLSIPCDRGQLEKLLCDLKDYIRNLLARVFGVVV